MNRLIKPISLIKQYDSKLEEKYAEYLDLRKYASNDSLLDWLYHPLRFRIGMGKWYTPDFMLIFRTHAEFHETKGYHKNIRASIGNIKTAAFLYPWWKWAIVTWERKVKDWALKYL